MLRLHSFDSDMGFSNATNIPITPDSNITNITFSFNSNNLSFGSYTLNTRSLDANGKWSITKVDKFTYDQMKLFVQVFYTNNSMMQPVLFNQMASNDLGILDTLTVELRNRTSPYAVKETVKGILQTNGLLRLNFISGAGSYYIAVRGINLVETWSKTPISMGANNTTLDFSTAATKAYGNNQLQVQSGIWALYNGDINQNGTIENSDFSLWESDANSFKSGFLVTDLNGDGSIENFDFSNWELNSDNFISEMKP